jgi:hypothetical protein
MDPDYNFSIDGLDHLLFVIEAGVVYNAPKLFSITSIINFPSEKFGEHIPGQNKAD